MAHARWGVRFVRSGCVHGKEVLKKFYAGASSQTMLQKQNKCLKNKKLILVSLSWVQEFSSGFCEFVNAHNVRLNSHHLFISLSLESFSVCTTIGGSCHLDFGMCNSDRCRCLRARFNCLAFQIHEL